MAFTEFYCNHDTGSNLNAGSTESGTAAHTYASGTWVASTRVFTVASGDPEAAGVAVGDFASVYPDAATVSPYVGRVSAVSSTTITIHATAISGTAPVDGTTNTTIKIGGAWKGPNAAVNFPFNFVSGVLVNTGDHPVRVNLKNNDIYDITATVNHNIVGNGVAFSGYTTTAGDGGKAIIDGGTTGASYTLLSIGTNCRGTIIQDLILQNNGATGNATGLSVANTSQGVTCLRVVVHDVQGHGFSTTSATSSFIECEAYACNKSNTGNLAGFNIGGLLVVLRCISHHNTGSNTHGFRFTGTNVTMSIIGCIADSNGGIGFQKSGTTQNNKLTFTNCDAYNNGSHGLDIAGSGAAGKGIAVIQNCNFIDNGGWGIKQTATQNCLAIITNCGFGSGTAANTSGTIETAGFNSTVRGIVTGTVTYAADVTPWTDPAAGDFRINLAAAMGAGRGAFTQTQAGYAGTVGYPDIGAAASVNPTPAAIATAVWARAGRTLT